jgi:hypothetical protein
MLAAERLLQIESLFNSHVSRIIVLELDDEFLRLIFYFEDRSNLRIAEQWEGDELKRYSYYWLTAENKLISGWENAPHHKRLENYPHHKHVGEQTNMQPSFENTLEMVMAVILEQTAET